MKKEKHKSSELNFIKNGSMKKILYLIVMVTIFSSCMEGSRGELTGVYGRSLWYHPDPYGMLYIPAGSFNMGQSDQDVPMAHYSRTKTVSQGAFYMDQTEISNNEYRQFVVWVRDSIARRKLGAEFPEEFLIPTYDDELEQKDEEQWTLNWNRRFRFNSMNPERGDNQDYAPLLADMFLIPNERFYQRKEIDTRKLNFERSE